MSGYQYRPDTPRVVGGKPRKYETPYQQPGGIDIPVAAGGKLGDPSEPLLVTEGSRKADAAASAGLCCVSLPGVWSWRGTNPVRGKVALPDWHDVALNGRRVVLAFDSDVTTKPAVAKALAGLAGYLQSKGARVEYLHLPGNGDGKTGLDDYLGAHGPAGIWALARPEPPAAAAPAAPSAAAAQQHTPPTPAPADLDGAGLLDAVADFLAGHVVFPDAHAADAVALWAAHTHLVAHFESTPRLALLSPEKQCGKSRVLELLELLCAGAETLSDASPAYLYRRIGAEGGPPVTILLDEGDAIWRRGKTDETAEALRSVVNAGHRRTATVGRVDMNGSAATPIRFPVYAPAAVAAIGTLPDTILDRAVVVRMRRRAPAERIRDYRERITRPEGEALRGQLAAWAQRVAGLVGDPWPDLPPGVADRPADVWEPLLAVAGLAGGDWPKRAAQACTAFVAGAHDESASAGTRLLEDLRGVFAGADALPTQVILDRLHALDEAPWGDWYGRPLDARHLARLLKPYGARPAVVRIGDATPRGYRAADLHDAWTRYGPVCATTATSATSLASHVADVADVADTGRCGQCGAPISPLRYAQAGRLCARCEATPGALDVRPGAGR